MKKKSKNEFWNLFFSAFLVVAYLVCSYFFIGIINESFSHDQPKKTVFTALIFVIFGLILFYSTRVGDGKQVRRFSLAALLLMVLPSLYVIIASAAEGLPFHEQISSRSEIALIAGCVLGYGIPYTFLSGFEIAAGQKTEQDETSASDEEASADTDETAETEETEVPEETEDTENAEDNNEPLSAEYDIENFS